MQAMNNGLQLDDYFHRAVLVGQDDWSTEGASAQGLFSFSEGDPKRVMAGMESGFGPWWTFEGVKLSFFRPLAEMTHRLDYFLWPNFIPGMHAHSLLWFGIFIYVVAVLYGRIMEPAWVAGLAACLYAFDEVHGVPVGWLANRNALLGGVFGICALIAHDSWRRRGWRAGSAVGPASFLLGLLSAEAALAVGGYLLAYEAFLLRANVRRAATGLLPYVIVALVWRLVYQRLDFGVWGSGAYLDPVLEPLLFLQAAIERGPILLLAQWLFPKASVYGVLHGFWALALWLGAAFFLVVATFILLPLLKRDPVARFWGAGMVGALLPVCAALPEDRHLLFVGLGAMGLLAQFLGTWIDGGRVMEMPRAQRVGTHSFGLLFVAIHCIAAPLKMPFAATSITDVEKWSSKPILNLPDSIAGKTVVFVNPPIPFMVVSARYIRIENDRPLPARTLILASGLTGYLDIARVADRALEIEPERGFMDLPLDRLFRGPTQPMRIGQQVVLTDMTAEVLSLTEDQRPLRARFSFLPPLEDPSLLFFVWEEDRFVPFELPAVGASVRLSPVLF
ncbi:MAG: hypothetical protein GKR89_17205 [Candidatus Latescibacteria bacterium]|nr:hypothetical protein [Candidatus Latescibacterota bacterium]